jgi:hypothetical protein
MIRIVGSFFRQEVYFDPFLINLANFTQGRSRYNFMAATRGSFLSSARTGDDFERGGYNKYVGDLYPIH